MGGETITAPAPVLGSEIEAGNLEGLCRAVWKRIAAEVLGQADDREHVHFPLKVRLDRVRRGFTIYGHRQPMDRLAADFEADLRAMLNASKLQLQGIVSMKAVSMSGQSPTSHLAALAQAETAQRNAAGMPRVQPAELLARFASQGVVIQALDGNLHVTPGDALTAVDREVLAAFCFVGVS